MTLGVGGTVLGQDNESVKKQSFLRNGKEVSVIGQGRRGGRAWGPELSNANNHSLLISF